MRARLAKAWSTFTEMFWVLPAAIIVACAIMALAVLHLDQRNLVPTWLVESPFVYSGGATGARTLLGAVASSTIGVAGTVFSITIAALSLAAGQMGPRLLRNFTRDRGNQATLGIFLGTFTYALFVLRTVAMIIATISCRIFRSASACCSPWSASACSFTSSNI